MFHTSEIHISKSALRNNIRFLRKKIGEGVRFSSVIKGNAYGHGIEDFVPLAEECGVRHFSVFTANEAYRVRQVIRNGSSLMIMGMIDDEELAWAIEKEVEFYVFDMDRLKKTIETAGNIRKPAIIHIEVETGLNRTGFSKEELPEMMNLVRENLEVLRIEGFCTHYAGAESIGNYLRIQNQISLYYETYEKMVKNGIVPKYRHTACSAAALAYPETIMDMVRIGIAQYGFWPSKETWMNHLQKVKDRTANPLRRIITWKSKVMSLKRVKAGEFIGYGTTFLASRDMLTASVPIGYANGFSRSLSNVGRVLVRGHRVSVIGIVNMNLLMLDVTGVPQVKKGDEVILIGNQKNLSITVASFGELSNQLNYELLTRLPMDIPRFVVK